MAASPGDPLFRGRFWNQATASMTDIPSCATVADCRDIRLVQLNLDVQREVSGGLESMFELSSETEIKNAR